MTWYEDAVGRYGPIIGGLLAGTAAKFGRALSEGRSISRNEVIADLLRLGLLGILAMGASSAFGLSGNWQAVAAAYLALGSDRLIQVFGDRLERRAMAAIDAVFPGGRDAS
jgi:hypothetical protein